MKRYSKLLATAIALLLFFIGVAVFRNRDPAKVDLVQPVPDMPAPTVTRRLEPLKVRGSIPYWDQDRAFTSFQQNISQFSSVSLFWYYLSEEGDVVTYRYANEDRTIIDFAHANNVDVIAVITNLPESQGSTWDSRRVELVIKDRESRAHHIREIVTKLKEFGFDGVSIDYEEVDADQESNFTQFIAELSDSLHTEGLYVGVALHPKRGKPEDRRYAFQDWKKLALYADELYLMAYGEHWDEGGPGPIASFPWVADIVRYAVNLRLPPDKLFLGIPLYGYDWQDGSRNEATGLTDADIQKLLGEHAVSTQWDQSSRSPFFRYDTAGQLHEVWYENAQSVKGKISLAETAGFAGVTFWRLGGEDPNIWETLTGRDIIQKNTSNL